MPAMAFAGMSLLPQTAEIGSLSAIGDLRILRAWANGPDLSGRARLDHPLFDQTANRRPQKALSLAPFSWEWIGANFRRKDP